MKMNIKMLNAAYTVKRTLGLRRNYLGDKYTCIDGWLTYNIAKGISKTEIISIIRSGPYKLNLPATFSKRFLKFWVTILNICRYLLIITFLTNIHIYAYINKVKIEGVNYDMYIKNTVSR